MMYLLLSHAFLTCLMTGVIWFVQVVHYPLFNSVGRSDYRGYHIGHVRRTTWIVAPIMLLELGTCIGLLIWNSDSEEQFFYWLNFGLLALIWLVTFSSQIPKHDLLLTGFDKQVHVRLVRSNWIRTVLWSNRLLIMIYLLTNNLSFSQIY